MNKAQKGFEWVCRQKKLDDNIIVVGLRESEKLIGQLYPVLVDEQGNILDGQHRLKANPDWCKEVVKGVDSDRKKAMIRIHANWHRRRTYPDQILTELAKITGWTGAAPYAAFLGCSVRTVQRYLPQQYKLRQRRTPKEELQLPVTLELEQSVSKRQLSLSEEKIMPPYEVELRKKILEEEFQKEREEAKERAKRYRAYTEWEKEHLKEIKIHNYFYRLSDDDIIAYVEKINDKAKQRVMNVTVDILSNRIEIREKEEKQRLFNEKVDELYAKFKQVTVEFTDETKVPLNLRLIRPSLWFYEGDRQIRPRDKEYPTHYLKEVILLAIVKEMLGFDEYGYAFDEEKGG